MPKRTRKTEADWANVLAVYDRIIREKGEDAPWIMKSHLYRLVADETKYTEESVKRIIVSSFKHKKKTA